MKKSLVVVFAVFFSLQLLLCSSFASADYDVDYHEPLYNGVPFYTDNYYPGMYSENDGIMLLSYAGYGSFANTGFTFAVSDTNDLYFPTDAVPSVYVGDGVVRGTYTKVIANPNSSGILFYQIAQNTYFDFQTSDLAFSVDSADFDTLVIDGRNNFKLRGRVYVTDSTNTTQYYLDLRPIAIQLLVDGKPTGPIIEIGVTQDGITNNSYTPNMNVAFGTTVPANVLMMFDNFEIKGITEYPELLGWRVYVDSVYAGDTQSFGVSETTTFQLQIGYEIVGTQGTWTLTNTGSASSDADLSNIVSMLRDGLFDGATSWLAKIYGSYYDSSGTNYFEGINSMMQYFKNDFIDEVFEWQDYDVNLGVLNDAADVVGISKLLFSAFQSIEENLGRLTYVFASDEEMELKEETSESLSAFKDNFGGGVSASNIGSLGDTVDNVSGLFNSGYGIGDLWDSLNSGTSWLSWFTTENALALDSVNAVNTLRDDDPYNMSYYWNHINKANDQRGSD